MKAKFIIVLLALLTCGGVQDVSAQKWLKALGSIADAVLGDDSSSNSSSSSSSSRSSSKSRKSSSASSSAMKKINVTLTDAVRYGTQCVRVGFLMENTSTDNLNVILKATRATWGGNEYYPNATLVGNCGFDYLMSTDYEMHITYASHRIPAGAKVKGYFYFCGATEDVTYIDKIAFKAYFQSSSDNGYSFDRDNAVGEEIETKMLPGIAIKDYTPSNINDCYCTNPDVRLTVNSLQRSGTTVTLSYTITNTGKILNCFFDDWSAYDENGTAYNAPTAPVRGLDITMNSKLLWSSSILKFAPGASATFKLKITDVPQSVKSFSLIRIPFKVHGCYPSLPGTDNFAKPYIILRNVNITAAPSSQSTTRTTTTYRKKTTRR